MYLQLLLQNKTASNSTFRYTYCTDSFSIATKCGTFSCRVSNMTDQPAISLLQAPEAVGRPGVSEAKRRAPPCNLCGRARWERDALRDGGSRALSWRLCALWGAAVHLLGHGMRWDFEVFMRIVLYFFMGRLGFELQ